MIQKPEIPISVHMSLKWKDKLEYPDRIEENYIKEFEMGWHQNKRKLRRAGHTNLKFDPSNLML